MERSNMEFMKEASDSSPRRNIENRSASKNTNNTILRDLQMKRAISIDKTILHPQKRGNKSSADNKVKLIN
jgi:hypothetical protein